MSSHGFPRPPHQPNNRWRRLQAGREFWVWRLFGWQLVWRFEKQRASSSSGFLVRPKKGWEHYGRRR